MAGNLEEAVLASLAQEDGAEADGQTHEGYKAA